MGSSGSNKSTSRSGGSGASTEENDSVEASLEDFISQANASFPEAIQDGWDLHTGDVELVDEADAGLPSGSVTVRPRAILTSAKGAQVETAAPAAQPVAQPAPQVAAQPAAQPSRARSTPRVIPGHAPAPVEEDDDISIDPDQATRVAPRKRFERTEMVSSPLPMGARASAAPAAVPWTANPMVLIGGILAAFIVGATVVFVMVRALVPTQPPMLAQPYGPQGMPVVTPLPSGAPPSAQPAGLPPQPATVTVVVPAPAAAPVPAPVAAAPVAAAPVVPVPAAAPVAASPVAVAPPPAAAPAAEPKSAPVEPAVQPVASAPAHAAPPKRVAPAPKPAASKPAASKPTAPPAEPAEKPAKAAPKKESKPAAGGGDWVDPF
jgi:hypothetical protein